MGWSGVDWIDLAQNRGRQRVVVSTAMNLRVPQNVRKFLSSRATGNVSRRAQLHGVSFFSYNVTYFKMSGESCLANGHDNIFCNIGGAIFCILLLFHHCSLSHSNTGLKRKLS
jgi:hypothetical protein